MASIYCTSNRTVPAGPPAWLCAKPETENCSTSFRRVLPREESFNSGFLRGRWLAYSSTDSGTEELYVTHFPSGEGRWQVSQAGGTYPTWRADSSEIYFFGLDGSLHSASVNTKGPEFSLNEIHTLFPIGFSAPLGNPYDVSPDGQRFIFSMLPEGVSSPMVMVTNWIADLKK